MTITLQQLADYYGVSVRTAQNIKREIQTFLGLPKKHKLLKLHVAKYEKLPLCEVAI